MGKLLAVLLLNLWNAVYMVPINDETTPIPTTCDAGEVSVDSTAHITCYFPTDIQQSSFTVTVTHFTHKFTKETAVLLCAKTIIGKPECLIHDGYSINYNITDELTVTIPMVTLNHAGVYLCQALPEQAPPKNCTLLVTDNTMPQPSTATLESSTKTSQIETGRENVQQDVRGLIIIIILVTTCSIQAIALIVILCIYRRKSRSRSYTNTSTNDNKAEKAEFRSWLKITSESGSADSGDKKPSPLSEDEIIPL